MRLFSATVLIPMDVNPAIFDKNFVDYQSARFIKKAERAAIIAVKLYKEQELTVKAICEELSI